MLGNVLGFEVKDSKCKLKLGFWILKKKGFTPLKMILSIKIS